MERPGAGAPTGLQSRGSRATTAGRFDSFAAPFARRFADGTNGNRGRRADQPPPPPGPQPPFPEQAQEPPGTEAAMEPRADHGEESYVGHGRLKDKVALITGADSGIGRAVAIAFAREGADVLASYLSEDDDAAETKRWVEDAGR